MNRTRLSWEDQLILELRLHDWDGSQIGDALAEVRDHCQEAGQSPVEAFGDATAYAQALVAERPERGLSDPMTPLDGVGILGGLLGLILAPQAAAAVLEGSRVQVSLGSTAVLLVVVLAASVLLLRPTPILRFLSRGGALPVLVLGFAPVVLVTALLYTLPGQLVSLPWPSVAALAVVALALSVLGLWPHREADPLRDPGTGHTDGPGRVLQWLTLLLFPILAVGAVVLTYLLSLG